MAKLYFRHGTVGSAKTLNLLAVAHNYQQQGKTVFLIKPQLDDRFGESNIRSRAGLQKKADLMLNESTELILQNFIGYDCILVDEVQFLAPIHIDFFRQISVELKIPVICYGLRTDFRTSLFPASKRLLELADTIEEIKTTCSYCNKKAIMNLKFLDDKPTIEGPQVDLGSEEKYLPACYSCYCDLLAKPKD